MSPKDVDGHELKVEQLVQLAIGRYKGKKQAVIKGIVYLGPHNVPPVWKLKMDNGSSWFNTSVRIIDEARSRP